MSKFQGLLELKWVPKPFLSDDEFQVAKALVANPSLQDNIPLKYVRVNDIEPTQHMLDKDQVAKFIQDKHFDGGLVVRRDDKLYQWDGHHRLAAAAAAGVNSINQRVLELPNQPVSLPQLSKFLDINPQDVHRALGKEDIHENDELTARLCAFLKMKCGSIASYWEGTLTSEEQMQLFGDYLFGKKLITIDGGQQTVHAKWQVNYGNGYETTPQFKWIDIPSRVDKTQWSRYI